MVHVRQWLLEPAGLEPKFEQQRSMLKGEPLSVLFYFASVLVSDQSCKTIAISAIFLNEMHHIGTEDTMLLLRVAGIS